MGGGLGWGLEGDLSVALLAQQLVGEALVDTIVISNFLDCELLAFALRHQLSKMPQEMPHFNRAKRLATGLGVLPNAKSHDRL